MSKKRRVKKQVKDRLARDVKDCHKYYKYATLMLKYRLSHPVMYVLDRGQSSSILNQEISNLGDLLVKNQTLRDSLYIGSSNNYPTFGLSEYDQHHNVMVAIRDSSNSKKVANSQRSGKAFKRLFTDYNKMAGQEMGWMDRMEPHQMYMAVCRLINRDAAVFTRFGSVWVKQDFKHVMSEQGLLWTEMVIDFKSFGVNQLMGYT